jgi:predicted regulator of Ras-like GTPase activity (Roadblock/LC7/MglB family)
MPALDTALEKLRAHPGVREVLVLGSDGLLIQHVGDGAIDPETVAAMVPGLAQAAASLGTAARRGAPLSVVLRLEHGVAVVEELSGDLLLALLLDEGVGFAGLLRDVQRERTHLAGIV